MAYILHYWELSKVARTPDDCDELKNVRLKSLEEAYPLALPHNRPSGTVLITVDRSDRKSEREIIVWDKNWEPNKIHAHRPVRRGPGRPRKVRR